MAQHGEPEWHCAEGQRPRRRRAQTSGWGRLALARWVRLVATIPPTRTRSALDHSYGSRSSMIRTTDSRPRFWNDRPMPPNALLQKICCAYRKPAVPGTFRSPSANPTGEPLQSTFSPRQRSRRSGVAAATTKPAESAQCRPTVEQSGPLRLPRQHPLPAAAEIPTPAVLEHQGSLVILEAWRADGRLRLHDQNSDRCTSLYWIY